MLRTGSGRNDEIHVMADACHGRLRLVSWYAELAEALSNHRHLIACGFFGSYSLDVRCEAASAA